MTISEVSPAVTAWAVANIGRGGAIAAAPIFASAAAAKTPTESQQGVLAKKLNQKWYELPEPFRFFVSGNLGNICFFGIERIVHNCLSQLQSPPKFIQEQTDSISFFLAYILQIVSQHLLHAWLVYGLESIDTREKYLRTLFGQSGAYFVALIGSTILNLWLRKTGMSKDVAFTTTLVVFACVNYFVIGWIVHKTIDVPEAPTSNKKGKRKESPKKKQQKAASTKQNKQKAPQKEIANKVAKRFGRGGAQLAPWLVDKAANNSRSVLEFVLCTGEPVVCLQNNCVTLKEYRETRR